MGLHGTHTRGLVRTAFCVFFIAILEDPAESSSDEVSYEVCEPRHCGGNRLNISYPFYIPGKGRELCGYPGFEITCEGTNAMYASYSVKNISYEENSIELASQMNISCFPPRPFTFASINIFLNKSLFLHPNLWFFYDCRSSSSFSFPTSPVSCPSNAKYNTCVALLPNGTYPHHNRSFHPNGTFRHPNESFPLFSVVPVQLKERFSNRTIKDVNYTKLLEDGVRLKWDLLTSKSCTDCLASGGRCGRSRETDFLCCCPRGTNHPRDCNGKLKAWSLMAKGALGGSISALVVAIFVLAYLHQRKISQQKPVVTGSRKMKNSHKCEVIFENRGVLVTRRYSYADIKRMTNSFQENLGQGGYGCVYKGKLPNGHLVAVKILSKLKGDGEDFINEVNSMSRTSHVNIVKLLGFCLHKTKRALVYEYMPNGSLEKLIYEDNYSKLGYHHLGWDILYQISLGIAQGLEYLHQGCNSRILHFDIKPHNILLDESYCPKISDFGLAKICYQEASTVSLLGVRGTAGFIAPEVFCRNIGGISQKSYVYSFGMTVLEMVGGRKNIVTGAEKTSEIFFPHWIHKRLELQEEFGLQNVTCEGDREKARKMIIVSLWCIQINPLIRPTMREVVDMLKGNADSLAVPPKPYMSSPSRSSPTTSMSMVV